MVIIENNTRIQNIVLIHLSSFAQLKNIFIHEKKKKRYNIDMTLKELVSKIYNIYIVLIDLFLYKWMIMQKLNCILITNWELIFRKYNKSCFSIYAMFSQSSLSHATTTLSQVLCFFV